MKIENKNKFHQGNISDFGETKGYFIGQFMGQRGKAFLETDEVEIAWKTLSGDFGDEAPHFHKKGVEINIVISGRYKVWIEGEERELGKGDFLVVYPEAKLRNISADEGTELMVVIAPSIPDDKY
jgi:quercetin dioxygenase-like cupin family protein